MGLLLRQSGGFAAFTLPISRFTAASKSRYVSQHQPAYCDSREQAPMTPTRILTAAWAMTMAALVAFPVTALAQTAPAKPQAKPPAAPAKPTAPAAAAAKPAAKPAAPAAKPETKQAAAKPVADNEPKLLGQ